MQFKYDNFLRMRNPERYFRESFPNEPVLSVMRITFLSYIDSILASWLDL